MLCVPAILHSLSLVRRYVADVADQAELDPRRAYRLCLAVDEVITNIVMHGYGAGGRSEHIDVWNWQDGNVLNLVVEDASPPYDPRFDTMPSLDQNRIEQGLGGLGLFLARINVDNLHYERRHGRNRHTFQVVR
jgi:serine/threonine-protein kinase RsbW